jgi:hypothetical protein
MANGAIVGLGHPLMHNRGIVAQCVFRWNGVGIDRLSFVAASFPRAFFSFASSAKESFLSMKKTELVKTLGRKIQGQMRQAQTPSRFGAAAAPDRREQRKLDQAAGLVPFAVKLPQELVDRLREQATAEGAGLNELTARLLQAGFGGTLAAKADAPAAKADSQVAEKVDQKAAQKAASKTAKKSTAAKSA